MPEAAEVQGKSLHSSSVRPVLSLSAEIARPSLRLLPARLTMGLQNGFDVNLVYLAFVEVSVKHTPFLPPLRTYYHFDKAWDDGIIFSPSSFTLDIFSHSILCILFFAGSFFAEAIFHITKFLRFSITIDIESELNLCIHHNLTLK